MSNELFLRPQVNKLNFSVDIVIECMRGLAALWVFLFHISDTIRHSLPSLYLFALEGYRGVPIFFAISGYCIFAAAQSSMARRSGVHTFLRRRLKRIYPTFWASIIVVMAMPYVLEVISSVKTGSFVEPTRAWMEYSAVDWLGVITLTKELVDVATGGSGAYVGINTVYWSLAIEVQFYLVIFVALCCGRYWALVITAVSFLSLLAVGLNTLHVPGLFLHLWPGFLCGVLVRLAHTRGLTPMSFFGRHQLLASAAMLGLVAGGCAVAADVGEINFLGTAVIASMVIWSLGGIEHAFVHLPLKSRLGAKIAAALLLPMTMLGKSSYSLYLLHGKVYQLPDMFIRQILPVTSALYAISLVVLTSALCYLFYYFIERKFHNHRLAETHGGTAPTAVRTVLTA